jgi:hypothetical protein
MNNSSSQTYPQSSTQWFAPPGIETAKNVYFQARTAFEIADVPAHFNIYVAAESWYRLWCNDEEVATGPARGTSALAFYDTLDLAPYLRHGTNEVRVLVTCANIPTFKAAPLRPALWIDSGSTPLLWQVARDTSFDSASPLYTFQIGYCEWRDLRVQPLDWQKPEYFTLDKKLLPRDCADLEQSTYQPRNIDFPVTIEAGGVLILDFEREIIGGAQLEIKARAASQIEIAYAEHLTNGEIRIRSHGENGEVGHTFADRFTTRDGRQVLGSTLQERGFRFLQIASDADIEILGACAVDRRHRLPPPHFHCDDEHFNRLYQIAHHTLSSCATDALTDCPWREATLYSNDLVVNALFWLTAGGDPRLVARCLRLALSERNVDGLIYAPCPSGGREDIVFLATNAFLPLILEDLARHDESLAREFLQPVGEVMNALTKYADENGLLVGPAHFWNFLDWSFEFQQWNFTGQAAASVNLFYELGIEAMADLCRRYDEPDTLWRKRGKGVSRSLRQRFWDDDKKLFREFEGENKYSQLAQALACLSADSEDIRPDLLKVLELDDDTLLKPELYMMHFVLRALIANGRTDAARLRLHRYWDAIVDADSPTLWESNVHQHGADAFQGWGSL